LVSIISRHKKYPFYIAQRVSDPMIDTKNQLSTILKLFFSSATRTTAMLVAGTGGAVHACR
jgi:hypothetical protein